MKRVDQASLRTLNTFGVKARAGRLVTLETSEDLETIAAGSFDPARDLVLGAGSNVLFCGDVPGTVYLNRIRGRGQSRPGDGRVRIEAAAGENWHDLVQWTLQQGLSGLENLSLIPGLAGAAPMQNIGAYGVELANVLESVLAWDWNKSDWREFSNTECRFAYRNSRFKSVEPDRYLITSIRLRLSDKFEPQLDYAGLREELSAMDVTHPDARNISEAVIRIRRRKLPDPAVTGNSGSFFKNPVVSTDESEDLGRTFPALPTWPAGDGQVKLSAAWMIEQCGWKGHREGDAGVSGRHALVLLNHGEADGVDIWRLAQKIRQSVVEQFGIELEPEPRIIGAG